ncbi:InlB B-repeat-containing protein [Ruminococcus sp. XPD3002]|uniref:InlB B-repeat-containing protein n=1 Tax=Ruminococcus sp. XPD3002 TaxID=1452269 RepID=UPI00091AB676|nr:Listeria/Bacterioides repeat-containing protein [Ruminococcus flavefaciens]
MRALKRTASMVNALMIMANVLFSVMPVAAPVTVTARAAEDMMQTVTAELYTDETYSEPLVSDTEITLTGVMPEEVSVKGYPVSCEIEDMETIAAYDITVFDGETVFQPSEKAINVTFSLPELVETDSGDISVFHIDDEGNQTEITDVIADSEKVSFDAESFSVYTIAKHEGEEIEVPRVEFHFLSDQCTEPDSADGYYTAPDYGYPNKAMQQLQSSQILLDGESLQLINDPPNHEDGIKKSYFYGWYVVDENSGLSDDDTVYYKWTDDPVRMVFEEPASISFNAEKNQISCVLGDYEEVLDVDEDGCAHVYLAPIYADYYFINFLNNEEANIYSNSLSLMNSKLIAFGADGKAESRIGNITAPSPDPRHKVFVGWKRHLDSPDADEDGFVSYITIDANGEEVCSPEGRDGYYIDCYLNEVDENNQINLYPVFAEARWINFHHDTGSTYVGSKYILTSDDSLGTSFTSLPVTNMVGYEFQGWFTEPEGGDQITDGEGNFIDSYNNAAEKYEITNGEFKAYKLPEGTEDTDITLYPHWRVKDDTEVTVNIWKQKSTDDVDLPDAEKDYDFDSFRSITTQTGNDLDTVIASLTDLFNELDGNEKFKGFHYNSYKNEMVKVVKNENATTKEDEYIIEAIPSVTSDGKTIVNIYYDRDVHELKFTDTNYTNYQETTDDYNTTNTQYGFWNNSYQRIYYRNGAWRQSDRNNGAIYNGTRYIQDNVVKTIRALYGHNISDNFPIVGDNGVTYENGERWNPTNSSYFSQVLVRLEKMPGEDIVFQMDSGGSRPEKTMNYYVEALPDDPDGEEHNGVKYKLYSTVVAKYNFVTESEDFSDLEGYTQDYSDPAFVSGKALNTKNPETINMYYTRNKCEFTYNVNYPTTDPDLSFNGVLYINDPSGEGTNMAHNTTEEVLFESNLSGMDVDYSPHNPDNYEFAGWYEDEACSKRFNFDSAMPAGNIVVFAKWEPIKFHVDIDPNGGIIDHIDHSVDDYRTKIFGDNIPEDFPEPIFPFGGPGGYDTSHSTYFSNTYNQAIEPYDKIDPPQYIPVSDEYAADLDENDVFYYMNMQYVPSIDKGGIPADLRNALYLTESELDAYYNNFYRPVLEAYQQADRAKYGDIPIVSFNVWKENYVSHEKYTRITDVTSNNYVLEGWYEVFEDGSLAEMPFDFNTLVEREYKLKAVWKLEGGYTVIYTPMYVDSDDQLLNGDIPVWQDPYLLPGRKDRNYADGADTTILRQPDNITVNGAPTNGYIFRGWRIVGNRGTYDDPDYYPLEPGVYYQPGEKFIIRSKYADSYDQIHMQAVYEKVGESYRRPDAAKLTLDSNGGHLTELNQDNTQLSGDISIDWTSWYDSDSIGTINTKLKDSDPVTEFDQLLFHSFQSNAAVHLYEYATGPEYYTGDDKNKSGSYFAHDDGYMLIGFDEAKNEGDYIATYPADGIISLQRNDDMTLYAVWEPTVYLNFENNTDKEITFALTASETQTLYIVNQATSLYDRVKVDDLSRITIPANETLRLAIPYGADNDITINGVNQLGTGNKLKIDSYLPPEDNEGEYTHHLGPDYTDNGQPFSFGEKLVEDPAGVKIVFESVPSEYVLILDDPEDTGRNTGTHEFDFTEDDLSKSFDLSETRSSTGYIFKGWSETEGSSTAEYPVTDSGQTIYLNELFRYAETDPETSAKIKTLYAVWEIYKESRIFHVYKEALLPCDPDKDFEFTVALYAPYTYKYGNFNRTGNGTVQASETFRLKNGEYLEIENDIEYNNNPHIQLNVQRYDANGEPVGEPVIITGQLSTTNQITLSNDYRVTVTETEYGNFDTETRILADTRDEGYSAAVNGDRVLYWSNPNTGGTALYTNTRKTADVDVVKELIDPESTEAGREFRFRAELVDTGSDKDYKMDLSENDREFVLQNGDTHTLKDLPVNARLRITEIDSYDHDVYTVSSKGSADLSSEARVFEFVIPEDGDTVTYTNELRKTKIAVYSYDEYNQPFMDASYLVSGNNGEFYPDLETGEFYSKDPMYLGSFTVTQKWCADDYEHITEPMNISIVGTDSSENNGMAVETDASNIRAVYDSSTDTWNIYIINHEKQIAPTGVGNTPTAALALTAVLSLMFCSAFVYINSRRKEVD